MDQHITLPENKVPGLGVAGGDRRVVADLMETRDKHSLSSYCCACKAIPFP